MTTTTDHPTAVPANPAAARAACLAEFAALRASRVRRCPQCHGVIYSTRFPTCRDCGAPLPGARRAQPVRVPADPGWPGMGGGLKVAA